MASVRAGRDARGAMNDLPIPGQPGSNVPDFDLNTMRSIPPAAAAAQSPEMTRFAPAVPVPMLPSYANNPQPSVDDKINRIMTPEPAVFKDPAVPPTPPQPQVPDIGIPNAGIPMLKPGSDPAPVSPPAPPPTDNTERNAQLIRGRPGIDPSTADTGGFAAAGGGSLVPHLLAMGIPAAIAALIARTLLTRGRGAGQLEEAMTADKALGAAGREVPPYPDDAIPPATDEARMRVNEASGGQPVTQETQDNLTRQMDINSGKIPPDQYAAGEKPKPGTEGYKQWFKFRQQQSKKGAPK